MGVEGGGHPPQEFTLALYYDLPVFELTQHFAREYKFTLGQDMKRDCLSLVRSIYRAHKTQHKEVPLETFLDDFEVLKLEIRLCTDLKLLPIRNQAELVELMEGISRQVTGWRNAHR